MKQKSALTVWYLENLRKYIPYEIYFHQCKKSMEGQFTSKLKSYYE